MPADNTELDQALADLVTQVAITEGTEASAVTLLNGIEAQVSAAVEAALIADNAADATSINAAKAAIVDTIARFKASSDKLGAAVAANTPQP